MLTTHQSLSRWTALLAGLCLFPASVVEAKHHEEGQASTSNIVETASANPNFSTLVTAVTAAGLVDALSNEQGAPLTVFAPTNDAFAKLPAGTVDSLLNEEGHETLKSILLYHVSPGKQMAQQVVDTPSIATLLDGQSLTVNVTDDGVMINNAKVTITDIQCTNGVIHVIDAVLLPTSQ